MNPLPSFQKMEKRFILQEITSQKKSFKRDKNGVSRLKIYRAFKKGDSWSEPEDLPFNNTNYSVAHPSLSSDGTKLYFASDMPGGKGASDIYVVTVLSDGTFGDPVNMGALVNTEEKETFPYIANSDILYFASNGHPGLGGLDIFKVDLNKENKATNLGSPINSSEDDFSLVVDSSEEIGYFASNRKGGKGSDDIYGLKRSDTDCFTFIEGNAYDKDSDKPLAETIVEALDYDGQKLAETVTASDGSYIIRIPCQEKQYQLSGKKRRLRSGNALYVNHQRQKTN
ncbi:TolB family protein [Zobellia nedashkovskayae]